MPDPWKRELVREPVAEGLFYPENRDSLRELIQRSLQNASTVSSEVKGLLAPYAGMDFISGLSAEAYKRIRSDDFQRIVIISPYKDAARDSFLLPESTAFRTPAGVSAVDVAALEFLMSSSTLAEISEVAHLQEQGIELQLPWIQYLYPDSRIVPILLHAKSTVGVKALASALHAMEADNPVPTLYIASANPTPAIPRDIAARQAGVFSNLLLEGRWEEMMAAHRRLELPGAGISCAAVLSLLLHRQCRPVILARGNSAEYDKNDSSVVEYLAVSYEKALRSGGTGADAAH